MFATFMTLWVGLLILSGVMLGLIKRSLDAAPPHEGGTWYVLNCGEKRAFPSYRAAEKYRRYVLKVCQVYSIVIYE